MCVHVCAVHVCACVFGKDGTDWGGDRAKFDDAKGKNTFVFGFADPACDRVWLRPRMEHDLCINTSLAPPAAVASRIASFVAGRSKSTPSAVTRVEPGAGLFFM